MQCIYCRKRYINSQWIEVPNLLLISGWFAGISKQATWLALFLQLLKQKAWVCQRVHMMVPLSLALSVRHIPTNCDHNSSSFNLKSAHCCLFLTTLSADLLLLFSFSSSCFLFFDFVPNPPPPFPLGSLSDDESTALKDNGRIALNWLMMISWWSGEKSMREQSTSSWSSACVQFSKYSWKRVHTVQSTFIGKKLSNAA